MEDRKCTTRWLVTTLFISLTGVLWGFIYILDRAADQDDVIRRIEEIAKVEIKYTRYKGAHHDIYLTADQPPTSGDEAGWNKGQGDDGNRSISTFPRIKGIPSPLYLQQFANRNSSQLSYRKPVPRDIAPFLQSPDKHDASILRHLLSVFLEACSTRGIRYLLHGGSLVGSYRHHGLVPWDTDIDFWVDKNDMSKLTKALTELGPSYGYVLSDSKLKFYLDNTTNVKNKTWKYPYIDVSFYKMLGNRVVDTHRRAATKYSYSESWIFPVARRPFEQHMVFVPRLTKAVIEQNYKLDTCQTSRFDHKFWTPNLNYSSISCELLYDYLPFVFRKQLSNFTLEELKIGNLLLQTAKLS